MKIILTALLTLFVVSCGQDQTAESNLQDIRSTSLADGYIKVSKELVVGTEGNVISNYSFAWCDSTSENCKRMGAKKAYPASQLSVAQFKALGLGLMQVIALPAEIMAASAAASMAAANVTATTVIVGAKKTADYLLSEKDTDYSSSDNVLSVYFYKFKNYIADKIEEVKDAVSGTYNEDNEKFNNNGTLAGLGWMINKLNPLGSFNKAKLFGNEALDGTLVTDDITNIKAQLEAELAKLDAK